MKWFNFFNGSVLLKIALGVSIIAIGYLTTMFYFQVQDLHASFNKIEEINETHFKLEQLNTLLKNDETRFTTLIDVKRIDLIKNESVLQSIIKKEILLLGDINYHNNKLHFELEQLYSLTNRRYLLIDSINISYNNEAQNVTTNNIESQIDKFKKLNLEIQDLISSIIQDENKMIEIFNLSFEKKLTQTRNTVLLIALVSILIFLLSYNKMDDDIYNLKKTNDELKIVNEIFRTSEEIASFGYWKYNLDNKKFTYSKNLYKIFQVTPESFEEHEYSILKFLHPDDVEGIAKIHEESIINKQPVSLFYRILMPDMSLKYMSAISSFTKNGKDEDVKIVVIQDISELYRSNLELKQINDKLLATNSELESFNNIISHDLQEPLRKIQMFISRLDETDPFTISPRGRDFFNKIKLASNRMQNLMIDMVNYARSIKEERILNTINLNKSVQEVLNNLNITNEESKYTIEIDPLPEIKGIQFQVNQLLENIIGNSLKYRKIDFCLELKINHCNLFNDEVHELADLPTSPKRNVTHKNYYKITIADNGIGFNPEYAQNVFQLFKRLENSDKYNGTGLGLAICKKIIENHRGYIKADSQINVGSVFSIYFPK